MFETFSKRARRIVFLSLKVAGQRGASAIEVEDLIESLVLEDQSDYSKIFRQPTIPGAPVPFMPQHRPFLAAETAAEIHRRLEPLLPKANPSPDSIDMPLSEASKDLFAAAIRLSEELGLGPPALSHIRLGHVEPLHLMAAALSQENSATAEVLRQTGITREPVIAAIASGEYS